MRSKRYYFALSLLTAVTLYGTGCGGNSKTLSGSTTPPVTTPTQTPSQGPTVADDLAISNPTGGASVSSPFKLTAKASSCSSQPVTAIGYGLDDAQKTVNSGGSLSAQISASAGSHTLHVTAWGNAGAACSTSVTVAVADPLIPSNAIKVTSLEAQSGWKFNHDPATGASSSGTTSLVSSPAISGKSRQFNTSFSGSGGEIYYITYGSDQASTNFFYDGWVYLTDSASNIANLELDMNQVTSNGQTVIYGFQCDGYSGTWDYTENAGTPTNYNDRWVHSNAYCKVSNWGKNTWHHIQIHYSRDNSGNVTYHSVWLDGKESKLEVKVPSSFALGWNSVLLTNFQIDGMGSGSNTVYLNNLTISRW